ncbi:MAG: hypothetical protein IPM54_13435 [Polyangiaceae bacterium]|nr:hypothetical protein [Polyangiaceae bacterium]
MSKRISQQMRTHVDVMKTNIEAAHDDLEVIGAVGAFMVYVCDKTGIDWREVLSDCEMVHDDAKRERRSLS